MPFKVKLATVEFSATQSLNYLLICQLNKVFFCLIKTLPSKFHKYTYTKKSTFIKKIPWTDIKELE